MRLHADLNLVTSQGLRPACYALDVSVTNPLCWQASVANGSLRHFTFGYIHHVKERSRLYFRRGGRGSSRLPVLCGARGIRTPDILLAKQALYQLSYGPDKRAHRKPLSGSGAGRS